MYKNLKFNKSKKGNGNYVSEELDKIVFWNKENKNKPKGSTNFVLLEEKSTCYIATEILVDISVCFDIVESEVNGSVFPRLREVLNINGLTYKYKDYKYKVKLSNGVEIKTDRLHLQFQNGAGFYISDYTNKNLPIAKHDQLMMEALIQRLQNLELPKIEGEGWFKLESDTYKNVQYSLKGGEIYAKTIPTIVSKPNDGYFNFIRQEYVSVPMLTKDDYSCEFKVEFVKKYPLSILDKYGISFEQFQKFVKFGGREYKLDLAQYIKNRDDLKIHPKPKVKHALIQKIFISRDAIYEGTVAYYTSKILGRLGGKVQHTVRYNEDNSLDMPHGSDLSASVTNFYSEIIELKAI